MPEIHILTLWEPWASLIALKFKQCETRSWGTDYRGKLAIHSAKRPIKQAECSAMLQGLTGDDRERLWDALCKITAKPPYGHIVAIVDVTGCEKMCASLIAAQTPLERAVGDWQVGRFAWTLDNIVAVPEPISFKGSQGLKPLAYDVSRQLQEATAG